jgi:hypothetical protein
MGRLRPIYNKAVKTKPQHWRGFQAENALKAAPMLGFLFCLLRLSAGDSTGLQQPSWT